MLIYRRDLNLNLAFLAWFIWPIRTKGQTFFPDLVIEYGWWVVGARVTFLPVLWGADPNFFWHVRGHGRQWPWKKVWPLTLVGQIDQAQNVNLKMANLSWDLLQYSHLVVFTSSLDCILKMFSVLLIPIPDLPLLLADYSLVWKTWWQRITSQILRYA